MTTTTAERGAASFEAATYAKVSLRLIPFLFRFLLGIACWRQA